MAIAGDIINPDVMGPGPPAKASTRAVIDGDLILRINDGATEIGILPKGIGLERLRFDGKKVVDLLTLTFMWVEDKGGLFILHCIPLPGCRLVEMTYSDRARLVNDGGTIRLLTEEEIAAAKAKASIESKNVKFLNDIGGDVEKALLLDVIKLLYCFIVAERQPNAQLGAWLDTQVANMAATFHWADERARMERLIDALKARMVNYYAD
jgi:hypothetical protein